MTREELKGKRIGVLMGGLSAEREVSLKSGQGVCDALCTSGFTAIPIDVGRDLPRVLARERIDVAFVALHGRFGEDGTVQGLLELMGIPYTGSGVLASALAMDKVFAKTAFQEAGLTVTPYRVISPGSPPDPVVEELGLPLVVKPAREGSSVGVSIVRDPAGFSRGVALAARFDDKIIAERYVKGREIQVAILDDEPLGTIEIIPANEFYDYEAKYTDGKARHVCPAPLSPEAEKRVLDDALKAHKALECSGYSRVDFLVTGEGIPYILEVNTLPGMTPLSLFPEIAASRGIPFPELVIRITQRASLKIGGESRTS